MSELDVRRWFSVWQGPLLDDRLAAAVERDSRSCAKLVATLSDQLVFDDEPAHFARTWPTGTAP